MTNRSTFRPSVQMLESRRCMAAAVGELLENADETADSAGTAIYGEIAVFTFDSIDIDASNNDGVWIDLGYPVRGGLLLAARDIDSFFAYDPNFTGGVFVSVRDINRDATRDHGDDHDGADMFLFNPDDIEDGDSTLYFDLIGNPPGTSSVVEVDEFFRELESESTSTSAAVGVHEVTGALVKIN